MWYSYTYTNVESGALRGADDEKSALAYETLNPALIIIIISFVRV